MCSIIFCCHHAGRAQRNSIGIKAGTLYSKAHFKWNEALENKTHTKNVRPILALFFEGNIYKNFYLGAELGTCSYRTFIDIKYDETGAVWQYFGWYQQEQFYLTINPQFKFGKSHWLSLGGGVGAYNNFVNQFHNGYWAVDLGSNYYQEDLSGENLYLPNTVIGGFVNVGANLRFNKNLGWIFEARYILNAPSNGQITKVKPDLSFNSFTTMTGLSISW